MRSFYSGHLPIYPIESPKMFIRKLFLAKKLKIFFPSNFYSGNKIIFQQAFVLDQVFDPDGDDVVHPKWPAKPR